MIMSRLLLCLLILTLSGCAASPTRPTASPSADRNGAESQPERAAAPPPAPATTFDREKHADDELLIYARRFGELSADSQKKEQSQVMQALGRNKKDTFNRLKAAVIYSLPGSRYRDNARALALLAELQRDKSLEDDIGALVALLKDFVEDRQRLEDNAAKLSQKTKDEQHRADELQQKLDALKNIEKTLIDRGQGTKK